MLKSKKLESNEAKLFCKKLLDFLAFFSYLSHPVRQSKSNVAKDYRAAVIMEKHLDKKSQQKPVVHTHEAQIFAIF